MNRNEYKEEAIITQNGGVEQYQLGEDSRPAPCSLLPCICGDDAVLDWGGCWDWNGRSWQRVDAGCKKCFRSVSIEIDSDSDNERSAAQNIVGSMWNDFIKANSSY